LHNILYAGFSLTAGWLADRMPKGHVLAFGYSLAALMALAIIFLPLNPWTLALIFTIGGIYIAIEETLEDSFCAELVPDSHHGMAFGTLATDNGIGDFASSIIVGLLWTCFGTSIAFGYSAVLFAAGAIAVDRRTIQSSGLLHFGTTTRRPSLSCVIQDGGARQSRSQGSLRRQLSAHADHPSAYCAGLF
jgi:MFS family permease